MYQLQVVWVACSLPRAPCAPSRGRAGRRMGPSARSAAPDRASRTCGTRSERQRGCRGAQARGLHRPALPGAQLCLGRSPSAPERRQTATERVAGRLRRPGCRGGGLWRRGPEAPPWSAGAAAPADALAMDQHSKPHRYAQHVAGSGMVDGPCQPLLRCEDERARHRNPKCLPAQVQPVAAVQPTSRQHASVGAHRGHVGSAPSLQRQ